MSKNQSKAEPDEHDQWMGDEVPDYVEPMPTFQTPARSKLETRLKIEDLVEQRRLKKLLGDYDSFEIGEERPRRIH